MTVDYLERVSRALVGALTEAQGLAAAGEIGASLAELLRHARELLGIADKELASAGRDAGEYARGLSSEIDERLAELEALLGATTREVMP